VPSGLNFRLWRESVRTPMVALLDPEWDVKGLLTLSSLSRLASKGTSQFLCIVSCVYSMMIAKRFNHLQAKLVFEGHP